MCHCGNNEQPVTIIEDSGEKKERGGQVKYAADVGDLESTGRKRAARYYPIPKEGEPGYPMVCEWSKLAFAGGGVIPIVGCNGNLAKAIHHGPNKNTLANHVGNVHRICPTCHNRFHTANDKFYEGERPKGDVPWLPVGYDLYPHNVELASDELMLTSEAAWKSGIHDMWADSVGRGPKKLEENSLSDLTE